VYAWDISWDMGNHGSREGFPGFLQRMDGKRFGKTFQDEAFRKGNTFSTYGGSFHEL
jgi:hypothetical protein